MYNPEAGNKALQAEDVVTALKMRGAEVVTQCTKTENYPEALEKPCDFIIIAGGDGTIEKIAKLLVDNPVPIAILPFGNANNIAQSLNVETALDGILHSWKIKDFSKFSVGSISIDHESQNFLESVGWGLFAEVLSEIHLEKKYKKPKAVEIEADMEKEGNKVEKGLNKLAQVVKELRPTYYGIMVDGEDYSGHYLWVEIMNTQSMGPQLQLAPEAHHGDDYLDVFLVKEEDRQKLNLFLNSQDFDMKPHQFKTLKAKNILVKSQEPIHIDDEIYHPKRIPSGSGDWLEISLHPQHFWVINA